MNPTPATLADASPWPHRLAVALVCAMFPLIWVGSLVTTYKAGMAVPDWPNTYGYNLLLYPWQTWIYGPWDLFVEHGHRLLGSLVGLLAIGFLVAAWRCEERRSIRWLSVLLLGAVIGQGLAGGLRVLEDKVQLARLHGCVAPLVFVLAVVLAAATSRGWRQAAWPQLTAAASAIQRLSLLTCVFAYVQIVLGSQLRHLSAQSGPHHFRAAVWLHLTMALVVAVHALLLARRILRMPQRPAALVRPALALIALVGLQILLGAGAWVTKYGWPDWLQSYGWAAGYVVEAESRGQVWTATAHVATGSLILATVALIALRSFKVLQAPARAPQATRMLMEATR